MELIVQKTLWNNVLEFTKSAQNKGTEPLQWAIQLSTSLNSAGVSLPSVQLAHLLVSHICWENNVPITWKYLEKALTGHLVPPMLVLALLSSRVIPSRRSRPGAYRLYMELLKRYAYSFKSQIHGPNYESIMKSIDEVLHLSEIFGLQVSEPGVLVVEYAFSIVWQLLDATLDDEGLLELTPENNFKWASRSQDMEIDGDDSFNHKIPEHHERLLKANSVMAVELIAQFFQNKITSRLLCLAQKNLPTHWKRFIENIRLLGSNSSALRSSNLISPEVLLQLSSDMQKVFSRESRNSLQTQFRAVTAPVFLSCSAGQYHGDSRSAIWLPLDLFLEDATDGSQVAPTSAIEDLSGYIKSLRAVNGTSWHDTFLGLWFAAIRLVQRERDPIEGPVPRLDTRLCMLLSIIILALANIIEEEEVAQADEAEHHPSKQWNNKQVEGKRRKDLVSSLQILGDYEGLLTSPPSISSVANLAAAKAMMFVSGLTVGSGYFDCISMSDLPMNCSGNLRHLIVEACIARNLLDTSAYFWPGYVNGRINQIPHSIPSQVPGWSSLMKGASLTPAMVNTLVSTPASSLAELEKIYDIAVNGSDDEKISAATILCGASFIRGWNIQEYTVRFVTNLLSPPIPPDYSGSDSHLICIAPSLNTLLVGISSVDAVQILSLHGLVPQLAGALMEICEVFGSCVPNRSWNLPSGEEINAHVVFSHAFILLLRLWRFNHPPIEHVMGDVPPVWSQLTPEYLLLVRNSQVASKNSPKDQNRNRKLSTAAMPSSTQPIFVDSFPKLKVWYRQHQACIASTLSGLVHGTPVHQIVDGLLNMMFRKMNKSGGQTLTSGSSSSSGQGSDDVSLRPKLPAWEILEAVPFVVDAALTACSHGRLSPRELATGLKDLADFLPASLATIVSYFSAEVTRGIWKPAFMNGTDWPSPAAYLSTAEDQIKRILATTGVDVPSLAQGGTSPATLPLPLAAFVSLTITYKLDKASERFLNLAGPALESLSAGCPWPCMPIVASLWSQKVKRWSDFLVFSASRTVFHHNSDAVVQLLKSCFTATLGLSGSPITNNGGIGALLGHGFGSHFYGGFSPVAPGVLYLRVYGCIRDIMFMTEEILSILMLSVREIATNGQQKERTEKLKKSKYGTRYGQVSLAEAMKKVKLAASLGASLVWLSGGSGLVHSLIQETLPSWFLSAHGPEQEGGHVGMGAMLGGYALAYFAFMCGTFAWGVDSVSPGSKRRPRVIGAHFEFMASALDGKISLGCDWATWRAYVSGFVSLMVACTPVWLLEVDVDVLKRLSKGLRLWNEEDLALALLGRSGIGAMGAAAELIIGSE
ncbi:hypothetical protein AQUCO_02600026v1 [Aquilegia coerulea]|uniref:Mediator of RNA polymerase II transcription subunit 33A n=1 Tax=Aquilegia coerulea TaxID=218851 RepID=A0A2G5D6Z9_AQUCA|nr:hypothetical protein AQUCO_02600026v1 [Aquilegia coerulea]